jgi:hypothetical protein
MLIAQGEVLVGVFADVGVKALADQGVKEVAICNKSKSAKAFTPTTACVTHE